MKRLSIPTPPMLEEAIGYSGEERYVAFFWSPAGDEASWNDGIAMVVGCNHHAYLAFLRHDAVWPFLTAYQFGNSDEEARHWLLLDRQERLLYAADAEEARALLSGQADRRYEQEPPPQLTPEQERELLHAIEDAMHAIPVPTWEEIKARMAEEWQQVQLLRAWLDAQPEADRGKRIMQAVMAGDNAAVKDLLPPVEEAA